MIDITIPPIRLYPEGDRDNNPLTRDYCGDRSMRIYLINVEGKAPRDPTKTRPYANAWFLPHGMNHIEKGAIGEDPVICFKRAMLYALQMHRPLMGDPPICHERWQNEILPAIAELQQQLEAIHV